MPKDTDPGLEVPSAPADMELSTLMHWYAVHDHGTDQGDRAERLAGLAETWDPDSNANFGTVFTDFVYFPADSPVDARDLAKIDFLKDVCFVISTAEDISSTRSNALTKDERTFVDSLTQDAKEAWGGCSGIGQSDEEEVKDGMASESARALADSLSRLAETCSNLIIFRKVTWMQAEAARGASSRVFHRGGVIPSDFRADLDILTDDETSSQVSFGDALS